MYIRNLFVVVALLITGFIFGVGFEYSAHKATIDDIQQSAMDACEIRIRTMKHTFK